MYTLYPGGAFMMCESLADFDPNVRPPVNEGAITDALRRTGDRFKATIHAAKTEWDEFPKHAVAEERASKRKSVKNESIGDIPAGTIPVRSPDPTVEVPVTVNPVTVRPMQTIDPVMEIVLKIGKVYEDDIKPILTTDYMDTGDMNANIAKLEIIRNKTTKVCNFLRKVICMTDAYVAMLMTAPTWNSTTFASHLGLFMTHHGQIGELGYQEYNYETCELPAFCSTYQIERIIAVILNSPQILDNIITKDTLAAIIECPSDSVVTSFNGMGDLVQCMYTDHDRRIRLERRSIRSLQFNHCMEDSINARSWATDFPKEMVTSFNQLLSTTLRSTMMESYEQLCAIMDHEFDSNTYTKVFKKLCYRLANIFGVATMILFAHAYRARELHGRMNALEEYDALLMDKLGLNINPGPAEISVTGSSSDYPSEE